MKQVDVTARSTFALVVVLVSVYKYSGLLVAVLIIFVHNPLTLFLKL